MKKFFKVIWEEICFVYREVKKSFSNEPSYFSSKRIERMLLFMTALISSNVWFWNKYPDLDVDGIVWYVGVHLAYAGYTMVHTERNKGIKQKENESTESKNG